MKKILPFLTTLIFFIVSLMTLRDYFISWDEPIHFERGQAYLHYFLTGKLNYSDLSNQNLQGTMGDPKIVEKPRRSLYQNDVHNGEYFLENDSGHPPLNGTLAALTNYIFYQKLGLLDDISSYHLFNILSSSLLVYVIVSFSLDFFGFLPALFSFLAISTYPVFFAESHFNIKDPVETAFFSATFFFFWKFWKEKKNIYLIPSFLSLTLAIGTKLNAFFMPIIFLLFLVFRYGKLLLGKNKFYDFLIKNYLLLFIGFIISLFAIILFWPYLRVNFPLNIIRIFTYYKDIGTNFRYQPDKFYLFGYNTFPIQWIFYTTPPILLLFTFVGAVFFLKNTKKYSYFPLFLFIWFLVPIIRVSLPGTTIYGGDRQIFEFLPALILIASFGFSELLALFDKLKISNIRYFLLIMFIWPICSIIYLHPNQNLYFNFLIGGLKGAYEKDFPSWGNSFGNIYQFGVKWVNENTEFNSKLALLQNVSSNIPANLLRSDIKYNKNNWSGINRDGEYLMEMIFNDTGKSFYYSWNYVNNFLLPLYEYKIDGVTLLRIWKNDLDHTSINSKYSEIKYSNFSLIKDSKIISFDLGKEVKLSRISFKLSSLSDTIFVEISDDKVNWKRMNDWIPFPQLGYISNYSNNIVNYFFAGETAKFLRLVFADNSIKQLDINSIIIFILQ